MEIYCVMVVDFQPRGRKELSTPDSWTLKRKAQEFCGAPVRFAQGTLALFDISI